MASADAIRCETLAQRRFAAFQMDPEQDVVRSGRHQAMQLRAGRFPRRGFDVDQCPAPGIERAGTVRIRPELGLVVEHGAEQFVDGDSLVRAFRHDVVDEPEHVGLSCGRPDRLADKEMRFRIAC